MYLQKKKILQERMLNQRTLYFSYCTGSYNQNSFIYSLVFSLEGRAWHDPEPKRDRYSSGYCILGNFLGVVCHCFPPPLDVPTLAVRCLRQL